MFISKSKTIAARRIPELVRTSTGSGNYTVIPGYTEEIKYLKGPEFSAGKRLWKPCTHTVVNKISGPASSFSYYEGRDYNGNVVPIKSFSNAAPQAEFDSSVLQSIWDQVDLNCSDAVLLYSGVVQAVPLLGGALKFNRIMRDVSRKLRADFKKKPFTTVLKSAISADFIDRFVVSPTIDDARKFADATNYVLRVMNTVHHRNMAPFALEGQSTTIFRESTSSGTSRVASSNIAYDYTRIEKRYSTTKMFALISGRYDTAAIDPVKLWATRVGLTRPLDSAWDLVPFSFVIDYFTRAGDFISALSDEMSSQEGLRASMCRIHALWYTLTNSHSLEYRCSAPYDLSGRVNVRGTEGYAKAESTVFVRAPVPDAWSRVLSLPTSIGDFVNVDLGVTRGRTLAELFIQAKL